MIARPLWLIVVIALLVGTVVTAPLGAVQSASVTGGDGLFQLTPRTRALPPTATPTPEPPERPVRSLPQGPGLVDPDSGRQPINPTSTATATPAPREEPVLRGSSPTPSPASRGTTAPAAQGQAATSGSNLGGLTSDALAASLFDPRLSVYPQRAVFGLGSAPQRRLIVDWGTTQDLPWQVVGQQTDGPGASSAMVFYRAAMDGLRPGQTYYYRATLSSSSGQVLTQTPITSFVPKNIAVRVRPLRINVIKDGDTDTIFGENHGEGRYSWMMRVDPQSDLWPPADIIGGCYPGGGSVQVGMPGMFRIPVYPLQLPGTSAGPYDGGSGNSPTLGGDDPTFTPDAVGGCAEDYSVPGIQYEANTAKVESGETIQLQAEPQEWVVTGPTSASGPGSPPGPMAIGQSPPTAGTTTDEGPPSEGGGGGGAPPPPPTCENRLPIGAYLPIHLTARGSEYDRIPQGNFPGSGTTIRKQTARNTEVVCFDLRAPDETVTVGVHAREGNWEFRIWFEVTLIYR